MPYTLTNEGDMPISVTALRDHCRIVGSDFDTQLTRSYYAAAFDIEKRAGLLLRPATVNVTLRGGDAVEGFVLPVDPADPSTISIIDSDGNEMEGWYLSPNTPEPRVFITNRTKFQHDGYYYLTYDAGLTSVPNDLQIAVLELAAHHFENRESTAPIQLHAVPSSVWSIVANYGRGKV